MCEAIDCFVLSPEKRKLLTEALREDDGRVHALPDNAGPGKAGKPYIPDHKVRQSLIAVFGVGMFDIEIKEMRLVHESKVPRKSGGHNWAVVYLTTVRLTVRDGHGHAVALEAAGTGEAFAGEEGVPPHHLASTSAEASAFKRAARNLGNFFGLSLYDNDDWQGGGAADFIERLRAPQDPPPPDAPAPEIRVEKPRTYQPPKPEPKPQRPRSPSPASRKRTPEARAEFEKRMRGNLRKLISEHRDLQRRYNADGNATWPNVLLEQGIASNAEIDIQGEEVLLKAGLALRQDKEALEAALQKKLADEDIPFSNSP